MPKIGSCVPLLPLKARLELSVTPPARTVYPLFVRNTVVFGSQLARILTHSCLSWQKELEGHGLWDFNRLSQPYIRTHVLQDAFGAQWKEIASKFLNEFQEMCYEVGLAGVSFAHEKGTDNSRLLCSEYANCCFCRTPRMRPLEPRSLHPGKRLSMRGLRTTEQWLFCNQSRAFESSSK